MEWWKVLLSIFLKWLLLPINSMHTLSMSMLIGKEVFDVESVPIHGNMQHLFVRQGTGLVAQKIFDRKLIFRPHSTDSDTHRKVKILFLQLLFWYPNVVLSFSGVTLIPQVLTLSPCITRFSVPHLCALLLWCVVSVEMRVMESSSECFERSLLHIRYEISTEVHH